MLKNFITMSIRQNVYSIKSKQALARYFRTLCQWWSVFSNLLDFRWRPWALWEESWFPFKLRSKDMPAFCQKSLKIANCFSNINKRHLIILKLKNYSWICAENKILAIQFSGVLCYFYYKKMFLARAGFRLRDPSSNFFNHVSTISTKRIENCVFGGQITTFRYPVLAKVGLKLILDKDLHVSIWKICIYWN